MTRPWVPFHGQWEAHERIAEILSGALRAEDDPCWAESGATDRAEYARWAEHLCGVACLRMALGARRLPVPRAMDLARELTRRGGYVEEPDGRIRGLIYAPAVAWLHEAHGIRAEVVTDTPAARIPAMIAGGAMYVASVHPAIRRPETTPPARGGHLVLVFHVADGLLHFHNPSGDTQRAQIGGRPTPEDFDRFHAGRGILIHP